MLIGGKEDCWITKELKPLKIQTKGKQPAALKKHTQHSWGLLLLIAAKSANIDMLNRLASLITGRVNMATAADPRGYPAGRRIACLFHILTPASVGLALRTKDTAIPQRSSPYFSLHSNLQKGSSFFFARQCATESFSFMSLPRSEEEEALAGTWLRFTQQQLVSYALGLPLYSINGFKYLNASWSWQGLPVCGV